MRSTSKLNKNIQRINAATETIGIISPGADLPIRMSQTLTSASFFFKRNTNKHEKLINALQMVLSLIGIGLVIAAMFSSLNGIGLALNAIDLLYQGTLITALGQSELASRPST